MSELADNLARAFDRIDDFEAVQSGRTPEQLLDAVVLLQESVGIRDRSRSEIAERLAGIDGVPRARYRRQTRFRGRRPAAAGGW
jgi:hypothetical protein